jgi:hypothetical protein
LAETEEIRDIDFDGALDILLDHETLKTGESYDDCVGIYLFFSPS